MKYGLPYKGSKNKIAEWVVSHFPDVDNLYDLFGGGGAITHCSILNKDFKKIYYNDLEKGLTQLFKDSVNGKYRNETEWISREDFFKRKGNDLYIRYCWSFGNNGKDYLYSVDKEPWKKALHYAKVLNDFSLFKEIGIDLNINEEDKDKRKTLINTKLKKNQEEYKKIYIDWYLNNKLGLSKEKIEELKKINKENLVKERDKEKKKLQRLERLESLQRLERLEKFKTIEFLNKSYNNIDIKKNSIVYCDIPYKNTNKYLINFDYEEFYYWCSKQQELVIISEYSMPEDKFFEIDKIEKISLLDNRKNENKIESGKVKEEKLFIPIHQKDLYKKLIKKEES
jgi:site-specific DNA-adenine methylase